MEKEGKVGSTEGLVFLEGNEGGGREREKESNWRKGGTVVSLRRDGEEREGKEREVEEKKRGGRRMGVLCYWGEGKEREGEEKKRE